MTGRRARGFSLVEVMVSSAILAVGLAAVASMFTTLRGEYRHQRNLVQALHIGEATMEDLLALYADDPEIAVGAHGGPTFAADGAPGGSFFSASWTVQDGVPFAGCREVVVTVQWSEDGVAKSFHLRTVRT